MAKFTVDSTVDELLNDPQARAVLEKHIPEKVNSPKFEGARPFPLNAIFSMAPPGSFADGLLEVIDEDLKKI